MISMRHHPSTELVPYPTWTRQGGHPGYYGIETETIESLRAEAEWHYLEDLLAPGGDLDQMEARGGPVFTADDGDDIPF